MHLTEREEKILGGEYGENMRKGMEILLAIGKIYNADRLIPITSAQVSGVSYYNIGDAGLEFLRDFSFNVKVSVKTTLNPSGMDLNRWQDLGIDKKFAEKQMEIIRIFKKMNVEPTLTCTPYLIGNSPNKGDHIAWAESSALTYANSVLGAMTNRESGISALAAAIIGKTPEYGMHIKINRKPMVRVKLEAEITDESDFGVLGYILGKKIGYEIPWIEGIKSAGIEELKMFSASIATYAGVPIFHIPGITAEWKDFDRPEEFVEIDRKDFDNAYEYFSDSFEEVDIVWIGCPHTTLEELRRISELLENKVVNTELWITTSRKVRNEAEKLGYIKIIEKTGAKVLSDTCLAVAPLKNMFKTLVTNSAKAFYYSRGMNRFKVRLANLNKCINVALKGRWR